MDILCFRFTGDTDNPISRGLFPLSHVWQIKKKKNYNFKIKEKIRENFQVSCDEVGMLKTRLLVLRKVFRAHVCLVNFTSSFISNVFIIIFHIPWETHENDYQDELRMCVSLSRDSITFGILPPPPAHWFFFLFSKFILTYEGHCTQIFYTSKLLALSKKICVAILCRYETPPCARSQAGVEKEKNRVSRWRACMPSTYVFVLINNFSLKKKN